MTEFKLVLGTKDGKSHQKEIKSPEADVLMGKKVGEKVQGDSIGFSGYEFELTGGSDKVGFPMRSDVPGTQRKRIFTNKSLGTKINRKGMKVRKMVAGNTVSEDINQINLKVTKEGSAPLTPPEAPAEGEEKPAEAAAEQAA
jgi:small subunit ribosomal protein S6e